jgi:hypothetical protein
MRLKIGSIDTFIAILMSVILLVATSGLVVYIATSSYSNNYSTETRRMSELAADVVTATNDLIDDCLGLTRSLAMQQASLAALQGDTSGLPFLQDQIGALLKTRPVLNSTFLFDWTARTTCPGRSSWARPRASPASWS